MSERSFQMGEIQDERLRGWVESWAEGRRGFHRADPYDALVDFFPLLTEGLTLDQSCRALVPLCGKSVDLPWLSDQGVSVLGAEGVPQAIEEFFEERGVQATQRELAHRSLYEHERISIVDGDFLTLDEAEVGRFDFCWDRASMIALPENLRGLYVERLCALLKQGGRILLVTYETARDPQIGPPYLVTEAEVRERYAPFGTVECLQRKAWGEIAGVTSAEATFLITLHV